MKKALFLTLLTFAFLPLQAAVVRPAPDFSYGGAEGRTSSLKSLRGQPVVLVVGRSPSDRAFRKQVKYLGEIYRRFAARDTIFVAAFSQESGPVESNIPFVVALNSPEVGAAYGVPAGKFGIFVIGTDGNLNLATSKVVSGDRIKEILDNAYPIQSAQRKDN